SAADCPADAMVPATTQCRASAGICDVAENCTGSGAACPPDVMRPSTFQCSGPSCASGTATHAQNCSGTSALCAPAQLEPCAAFGCLGQACRTECTADNDC